MFFLNIFKNKKNVAEEEIPRYPPFIRGLPLASIDKILADQDDILYQLRQSVRASDSLYESLYLAALKRYASFVHLMPASETHHHRGAGGLLRHGLEVALWATQAADRVMFALEEAPQARKEIVPRWEFAVFVAALCHDIGKPVIDISISDASGEKIWNPFGADLVSWGKENKLDRYFIRWKKGRKHKGHETLSNSVIARVIDEKAHEFLCGSKMGAEPLEAIYESVLGNVSGKNIVYDLVLSADRKSTEKDIKERGETGASLGNDYGVPVERYLLDGMRRLIKENRWKVNKSGARCWVIDKDFYIVWPQGASDVTDILKRDNVPGIPKDPDSIADILIERDLATPDEQEEQTYRYWSIAPEQLNGVKLKALKLKTADMIMDPAPPSVPGEVLPAVAAANEFLTKKEEEAAAEETKEPTGLLKPVKKIEDDEVIPPPKPVFDESGDEIAGKEQISEKPEEEVVPAPKSTSTIVSEESSLEGQDTEEFDPFSDNLPEGPLPKHESVAEVSGEGEVDLLADEEEEVVIEVSVSTEETLKQDAQPHSETSAKKKKSTKKDSEKKSGLTEKDVAPAPPTEEPPGYADVMQEDGSIVKVYDKDIPEEYLQQPSTSSVLGFEGAPECEIQINTPEEMNAYDLLNSGGDYTLSLVYLADNLRKGKDHRWQRAAILYEKDMVALAYPHALEGLGYNASDIREELQKLNWIVLDPTFNKWTIDVDGFLPSSKNKKSSRRCIVLNPEISEAFLLLAQRSVNESENQEDNTDDDEIIEGDDRITNDATEIAEYLTEQLLKEDIDLQYTKDEGWRSFELRDVSKLVLYARQWDYSFQTVRDVIECLPEVGPFEIEEEEGSNKRYLKIKEGSIQ